MERALRIRRAREEAEASRRRRTRDRNLKREADRRAAARHQEEQRRLRVSHAGMVMIEGTWIPGWAAGLQRDIEQWDGQP